MPPKIKVTKEQIIKAAVDIVRKEGEGALNARSLAKALNCSTGPLFRDFNSMDEIKLAVMNEAFAIYSSFIEKNKIEYDSSNKKYKGAGMAYLQFAKNEKELFKMLFMRNLIEEYSNSGEKLSEENHPEDPNLDYLIKTIVEKTGLNYEKAKELHFHSWIYSHGLASMMATNFLEFSDEQLSDFLTVQFEALVPLFKSVDK